MSILMMLATVVLATIAVLRLAAYLSRTPTFGSMSNTVEFAEKSLTIVAILAAGFWYFFERPDSAKVDIEQSVAIQPAQPGFVLLLTEISIKNVGSTVLDFNNSPYTIEVLQITPLTKVPAKEYSDDYGRSVRRMHGADEWSLVGRYQSDEKVPGLKKSEMEIEGLTSLIESNETENLYHRLILACQPDLRLAVRSQFRKPKTWQDNLAQRPTVYWTKQTYVDVTEACVTDNKGARK
ncbi:hypothetical protein [Phenylobacterium sp.]|uniref:hypothetical protein n=1 Tax=Phenylobacterium sp. TaxID=1871053 RepID=UPI002869F33D|nr:hypothetical protein [Phenylobacterium sp.]